MPRYAVYKRISRMNLWVCAANDLIEAHQKMLNSARKTGLEHFVYDFELKRLVATSSEDGGAAGSGPK